MEILSTFIFGFLGLMIFANASRSYELRLARAIRRRKQLSRVTR